MGNKYRLINIFLRIEYSECTVEVQSIQIEYSEYTIDSKSHAQNFRFWLQLLIIGHVSIRVLIINIFGLKMNLNRFKQYQKLLYIYRSHKTKLQIYRSITVK